jgi:hypothetical protein
MTDYADIIARLESATGPDRATKACAECGAIFARGKLYPSEWAEKRFCSRRHSNRLKVLPPEQFLDRLFAKARNENGCMVFAGAKKSDGYGSVTWGGVTSKAHRIVYELKRGPIPAGMCVMHSCDNRACINPEHLSLGTNADNTKDRDHKNRQARGEKSGRAVLSENAVRSIRASEASYADLAKRYGVGETAVRSAKLGLSWRHVR